MTFATEILLDVEVEVLEATRAEPGAVSDRPERSTPAEPAELVLAVWLRGDAAVGRIDLRPWLPAAVLEGLEEDALAQLTEEAGEP